MARLTEKQRELILADFHVGKSQNELSRKYNVSPATINKLCKGVIPKYKEKVNTVVAIKSELSEENEYQVNAFDKEVNELIKNRNLVFGVTHKALKKANELLDKTDNMYDVNAAVQLADRASITLGINPRHATSQVNIQNNQNIEPAKIIREIIDVRVVD